MEIKTNEEWGLHVEHCLFCDNIYEAENLKEASNAENIRTTICDKCRFVLAVLGNHIGAEVLKSTYDNPHNDTSPLDKLRGLCKAIRLQTKDALHHISSKLPASGMLARMYRQRFLDRNQSE